MCYHHPRRSTVSVVNSLLRVALMGLNLRADFPIFSHPDHANLVFLDSAASAQKPAAVLERMQSFYTTSYANIHRGVYGLSEKATEAYEGVRPVVQRFINARSTEEIIFTRGTTEAMNLVAHAWGRKFLSSGDEILLTVLEHHANLVPWQILAEERGAKILFARLDSEGRLDKGDFLSKLSSRTKLVGITALSNALGVVPPLKELVAAARAFGALVVVDGAQAAPHLGLDVQEIGCDFLAFSGHKLYGPTGVGVLYGRKEVLESMPPFLGGGDMVRKVTLEGTTFADPPHRFEAGTPPIVEVVGLGAAIEYLESIGLERVHTHEAALVQLLEDELARVPEVRVLGPHREHSALVTFTVEGVHPHDLAQFLDQEGIAVRAGNHCAQPLLKELGLHASTRASIGAYNTPEEVVRLREALQKAVQFFC